ncbi:MAG: sigma 54-interacting transcriptional regulator [Cyanobacteriota bacterium]|nr:sigma 54-interacting transcriptional regulator [Cyanobacteriota bacterium]
MVLRTIGIPWLQEQTPLSILSQEALTWLWEHGQEQSLQTHQRLVLEDTPVLGLYLLLEGRLESYRSRQTGMAWATSLLPGSLLHLPELILQQPAQRTVVALSDVQLAFLPAPAFREWIQQFPEVTQVFSQQLAQELAQVSAQLLYEQDRQTALRPYLVTKASRGIVGNSRYAVRLRQQIKEASQDRRPALIFGEPGLEKDNIAALIHFSSAQRREPMIKVNCALLQASGSELLGRAGGRPGLLEWLGSGTLLLNNVQDLHPDFLPKLANLLETGRYTPVRRLEEPVEERICQARILMISEKTLPTLDPWVGHAIKVPPLRVRKADLKAQVEYYLSLVSRSRRIPRPTIAPEALRRLQSYDFPGNLRELKSLVERAVVQSANPNGGIPILGEEVFWSTGSKSKRFRLNLLNAYPRLRKFLRSGWWPDGLNWGVVLPAYTVVVFLLLWGPQDRPHNLGLNLFWAWWWPGILLAFPFVGRLWCAVCPFMIYGELTQKLSLWLLPRPLRRWPRQVMEAGGGWFLVSLFGLIFLWEELWDLPHTAYLSAWLLLLITAGAVVGSLLFERRLWCRYLCPIGGMNGLYAKLSMTELRAQQGTCSAECTTYQCYKGGPAKGEGQASLGCPLYSHPAQLQENKDCVLCMTCLKACPHRSVEFNLRPPAIELWTSHTPKASEVALLLLLLGGIYLHHLPQLQALLINHGQIPVNLDSFVGHLGLSLLTLGIPTLVPLLAHGLAQWGSVKPRPFLEWIYGYLPLVWGGTLAHYLEAGLREAGQILPVSWQTFGLTGTGLPTLTADPAVVSFLQGSVLLFSLFASLLLLQKITRQSLLTLLPMISGSLLLTGSLWGLILP